MRAVLAAAAAVLLAGAGLAAAAPAASARGGVCVVSADNDHSPDACGPYRYPQSRGITGDVEVDNGVWSVPAGFTNRTCRAGRRPCQTLYAASPGRWHVVANYPAGNTSVQSYPATYQAVDWVNGREPKLSRWGSITSSYAETFTAHATRGTIAEAAYDIFLNNWASEVMIQVDFAGDRQRPRCDVNGDVIARQQFAGHPWNLCGDSSELIWQPPTGINRPSGRVPVLAMLRWLETHGHGRYLPARSGLTAFGFGFEICSTGGHPETFPLTGFTLTAKVARR